MLSVALAVKNEESNIRTCLSSVTDIAGEIVVVDGGSTDKTADWWKGSMGIQPDNQKRRLPDEH